MRKILLILLLLPILATAQQTGTPTTGGYQVGGTQVTPYRLGTGTAAKLRLYAGASFGYYDLIGKASIDSLKAFKADSARLYGVVMPMVVSGSNNTASTFLMDVNTTQKSGFYSIPSSALNIPPGVNTNNDFIQSINVRHTNVANNKGFKLFNQIGARELWWQTYNSDINLYLNARIWDTYNMPIGATGQSVRFKADGTMEPYTPAAGNAGTVTSVSGVNANGHTITVTNPSTTPAITVLSDTVNYFQGKVAANLWRTLANTRDAQNVKLTGTQTVPGYKVLGRIDVRGVDTTFATGVTGYASTVITRRSVFASNNNETVLVSFRPLSTTNTDPGTSLPYTGNQAKAFDWIGDISGPSVGSATIGKTRTVNEAYFLSLVGTTTAIGTLNGLNNNPISFGTGGAFGFMDVTSAGTQRNRFAWGATTPTSEAKFTVNNAGLYALSGQANGYLNEGGLFASFDNDIISAYTANASYNTGATAVSTFTASFSGTGTPAASNNYSFSGGSGSGAVFFVSFTNNATTATVSKVVGGTGYTVGNVLTRTINGLTVNITITAVGLTGVKTASFRARNAPILIDNNAIGTATAAATSLMREADGTVTQGSALRMANYTASGNGTSTTIVVPHGVTGVTSATPFAVAVHSLAAAGFSYTTIDATNVNIIYPAAPANGTNNLAYTISIKP